MEEDSKGSVSHPGQRDSELLGRDIHREGNGTPLQYSCLENPMDGGAWWAAVSGVAQSGTRLKRLSSSINRGGLPQCVSGKESTYNAGDMSSIPG